VEVPKIDHPLDLSTLPADATADQLEERMMAIMTYRPANITSQEQAMALVEKQSATLKTTADLMLKREDASEEQKDMARMIQLRIIAMSARNDLDKALEAIEAYQIELAEAKSVVYIKPK